MTRNENYRHEYACSPRAIRFGSQQTICMHDKQKQHNPSSSELTFSADVQPREIANEHGGANHTCCWAKSNWSKVSNT